ncbi:hypothetical protein [Herbaspirillum rubrisubalbicans]|uniref:hypothetical protein n=1 Tax=Herbaspirillum rubrisubalbicans TaxID=80842 RepID=UPI0015C57C3E|nr:hypothetical protein [Herbaspirillum rubrisubalbicans]NQE51833.1 hypothetical protein [Herbaspirillum rubrisubalbicans]
MDDVGKNKTYFELLAERELLDRELTQARAREAESALKEIAERMWLFEFSPRDVEKAYRKHELVHGNPKVMREIRGKKAELSRGSLNLNGSDGVPEGAISVSGE